MTVVVDTPQGPARLHIDESRARRSRGAVMLGHGAGGGVDARDLVALAEELPLRGYDVVRMEQPWRVAGKRIAPRPALLDEAWRHAVGYVVRELPVSRLVVGGRSAGARVALRTAALSGLPEGEGPAPVVGVLALAFPLHPPGKPERTRREELTASVPVLLVQGSRDAFGRPEEFDRVPAGPELSVVPDADHGFAVSRSAVITQQEAAQLIVQRCLQWLERLP
jgi:predicted alpha/beta-hydrolase family hydrolase